MNYYPFHIGDYQAHTAHLDLLEDLAYRRMIDVYYTRDGALPLDVAGVARLIRMSQHVETVRTVLAEFFSKTETGWINQRCEREIEAFNHKSTQAKASIAARWKKEKEPESYEGNTNVSPPYNEGNTPRTRTRTNNQNQRNTKNTTTATAVAAPDGVLLSVWTDFVDLRKSKKAKLTQTAIDGIRKEADKAGWTLEAALQECCCRGWIGFKADWVAAKPANTQRKPTSQAESFREHDDRVARERWEQLTGQKHPELHQKHSANIIDITPAVAPFERIAQ